MVKDTNFYDRESAEYSEKRYPKIIVSYTHFLFKQRLQLLGGLVKKYIADRRALSFLEIGCADGIVARNIFDSYGKNFSSMKAVDISPGMIESARKKHADTPIVFNIRDYNVKEKYDLVLEIGVINYADIEKELSYAHLMLKKGGVYMCTFAGRGSFWDKFLNVSDKGFSNFLYYDEYESKMKKYFFIAEKIPVGLYLPFIWRFPGVAGIIQPLLDFMFRPLPNIFHENIYVLKAKG